MKLFSSAIRALQALAIPKFTVSNYFPFLNEVVTLENISENEDSISWETNDGTTDLPVVTTETTDITITNFGDLPQTLNAVNTVGTKTLTKNLYPINDIDRAYYDFNLDEETIRNDESVNLNLVNLYNFTDPHTVQILVRDHYNEDDATNVVLTINDAVGKQTFDILDRGIYDIELVVTTGSNVTYCRKQMILTVTPALQNRASAIEFPILPQLSTEIMNRYGTPKAILNGDRVVFWDGGANPNHEMVITPGTTIVLSKAVGFNEDDFYRIELSNLRGTAENPIIITFDSASPLSLNFLSWNCIAIIDCEHVIIDGRGYQNIPLGLKMQSDLETNESVGAGKIGIQVAGITTDIEIHNMECFHVTFAGIMAKNDPVYNDPTTQRYDPVTNPVGMLMDNLVIHHINVHDVGGEGLYLGYFDTSLLEREVDGITYTYRAHQLKDCKVFRNEFRRCAWDSVQLNSGSGNVEIAYNLLEDSGYYGEINQNTCMSVSLAGKIYGNRVYGGTGLAIQIGALGEVQIFNNLIYNNGEGSAVIYLLGLDGDTPETTISADPNDTNDNAMGNDIPIEIYNNVLIAIGNATLIAAQNVVQWRNLKFRNNVYQCPEGKEFGGMSDWTISLWRAYFDTVPNFNLTTGVEPTKIADIELGDFNIHYTSFLASGGVDTMWPYDIRGAKVTNGTRHLGAYRPIVESVNSLLTLNGISIVEAPETENDNVTVVFDYSLGVPSEYMISEDVNFAGATWEDFSLLSNNRVSYPLSSGDGVKTIYAKFRLNGEETSAVNASVEKITPSIYPVFLFDFGLASFWETNINDDGIQANNFTTNHIIGGTSEGIALSPLLDTENNAIAGTSALASNFSASGGNLGTTVPTVYLYNNDHLPRDNFSTPDGQAGIITITGLTGNSYQVKTFSSQFFGANQQSKITVNGSSQITTHYDNADEVLVFDNVIPASGEITVQVESSVVNAIYKGYINVMEIIQIS
jgi:hypothetical protein